MQWQKKLTQKQRAHLRWLCNGRPTLGAFKRSRAQQLVDKTLALAAGYSPGVAEPCQECQEISVRLGLENQLIAGIEENTKEAPE